MIKKELILNGATYIFRGQQKSKSLVYILHFVARQFFVL